MNSNSKIIILMSFIIVLFGFFLINNIKSNTIVENFENDLQDDETSTITCISNCIISFDSCKKTDISKNNQSIIKCNWYNPFNVDLSHNCNQCSIIDDISYSTTNNSYQFKYKNKNITLETDQYMDNNGNIFTNNNKFTPLSKEHGKLSLNNLVINDSVDKDLINKDLINKDLINKDSSKYLNTHISGLFDNYLNSLINNNINSRNVGTNLNTSPHHDIKYLNLNSALINLVDANSNNRLIHDNPYIQHQSCINSQGKVAECPQPYDYKPSMYH